MVIATMSLLSILVTEFTYIAQINQKIAFDSLDQVKAQYLAKSGFKLSLLRLKAYLSIKGLASGGESGGLGAALPKGMLDQIWSFPFFYPIPTELPGMSRMEKESIEKFQDSSGLEGRFSAVIEAESGKYNLNLILAPYVQRVPPSPPAPPPPGQPAPAPSATPAPIFDPEAARKSLADYMYGILKGKFESDQEFAEEYRDTRIDDLVDSIAAWADRGYQRVGGGMRDEMTLKRAPFYSLEELHMVPGFDDALFDLFAPNFTASPTPGLNVNVMRAETFKALVPGLTEEEVKEFFKYRDDPEEDHLFKDEAAFFGYLQPLTPFRNSEEEIARFKEDLKRRNIRIVTDETDFKITVKAQVNQSTRLLEAWVVVGRKKQLQTSPNQPSTAPAAPGSGIRLTFMRIS